MKGVILAAGKGTRLYPLTKGIPKVLLPVYNKPMIFYAIENFVEVGIKDIIIVNSPDGDTIMRKTLEGEFPGVNFTYLIQEVPQGNAHSFRIAEEYFRGEPVVLMFADNIILGDVKPIFREAFVNLKHNKSSIFSYTVPNPVQFGVVESDEEGNVISLEEKPEFPKSDQVAIGLYVFMPDVVNKLRNLVPSKRGEYEITDVNKQFLKEGRLACVKLGSSCSWFDTGNVDELYRAATVVKNMLNR